ncbi:MAG: FtsB family cell division protein [Minwuia sp.]|uniref:FtsB family cell division protein n=1 Tax=Minwuia sp. TaxID=2493630 RepID=UPI003A84A62E
MHFANSSKGALSRLAVPAICLALIAYFGFHGIQGERGLNALQSLEDETAARQDELARLNAEREILQRRVDLISGPEVDGDILGEQVRRLFGWTAPGEIVIYQKAGEDQR